MAMDAHQQGHSLFRAENHRWGAVLRSSSGEIQKVYLSRNLADPYAARQAAQHGADKISFAMNPTLRLHRSSLLAGVLGAVLFLIVYAVSGSNSLLLALLFVLVPLLVWEALPQLKNELRGSWISFTPSLDSDSLVKILDNISEAAVQLPDHQAALWQTVVGSLEKRESFSSEVGLYEALQIMSTKAALAGEARRNTLGLAGVDNALELESFSPVPTEKKEVDAISGQLNHVMGELDREVAIQKSLAEEFRTQSNPLDSPSAEG